MDSIFNLSVIIAAVDQLTGPVREMARSLVDMDRLAARGVALQEWGTRAQVAGQLTGAVANSMMARLRGPIEVAAEFQEAMSLVGAVTNNITGEEFEALRRQALELGAATTFSASQAAEGMGFLAKAGFTAQEQMAAMPAMLDLARAGAVDLATTADIASNILSGFGLDASEMTRVADVMTAVFTTANTDIPMLGDTMKYIAPVARAAGMSLEEAAAMAGLLGNAGIQSSQAGTTLRSMLQRLAAPSGEAAKALEALGISVADENGNMRSMVALLGEVGDAIDGLGTQQQLEIIGTVFGREAAAGAAELLAQGQSIADYVDQLTASQGRAAAVAAEMSNNYRGAQEEFSGAIETLNIVLGDALLPMLTEFTLKLAEIASGFGEWVAANPELARMVMMVAGVAAGTLAIVAPILTVIGSFATMAGVGLQVLSKVGVAFVWLLPKIGAASVSIGLFAGRLVLGAASAIPAFLSGITAIGAAAAGRLVAGLRAAAVAARAFGLALMANPIGLVIAAIAAAALLVWYYWEPISEFFIDLWARVQTAFEGFSSWVSGWWSRLTGWLAQGFEWASMIPDLTWSDFVALLTWENFLTFLDWVSWLIPLRWLDYIPGFSWAEVIQGVIDWGAWVSSLSWSEFVDLLTWENVIAALDWASWILPVRWLEFIPGFSWSAVLDGVLDWGAWILSLDWLDFIPPFDWSAALEVLDWAAWLNPLNWGAWIAGLDWASFVPAISWGDVLTVLDWLSWVSPLRWLEFIPGFSWSAVLDGVLDWGAWILSLDWLDFIPPFDWSAALEVLDWAAWLNPLNWGAWIAGLDWASFVPAISWGDVLTVLDWLSWILPIRWLEFIPGFSWSAVFDGVLDWGAWILSLDWLDFIPPFDWSAALAVLDWAAWLNPLNWGAWVAGLDWAAYVPAISWGDVLTALDWASWILPIRWLEFIPGFSWSAVFDGVLDWGAWILSLDWLDFIPPFDWSAALEVLDWAAWLNPLNWGAWVAGLDWASFVPAISWGDVLTAISWGVTIGIENLRASWQAVRDFFSGIEWSAMLPEFDWGDIIPDLRPALDAILGPGADAPLLDQLSFVRAGDGFFYGWTEGVNLVEQYRQGVIGLDALHAQVSASAGGWTSTGTVAQRLKDIIEASAEFQTLTGQASPAQIIDPATLAEAEAAAARLAETLPEIDAAAAQTRAAVGAELTAVEGAVSAAVRAVTSVLAGVSLRDHGVAFMRTLAEGIRAGAVHAVEAVRETVQAMRDHLPHSPAKVGPLSDLDRVRFSETLAGAVQPAPAVAAVHRLTAGMAAALAGATMSLPAMAAQVPEIGSSNLPVLQVAAALPQVGLTSGGAGASGAASAAPGGVDAAPRVEINFNPTITIQGGAGGGDGAASREQLQDLMRSMGHELVQLVQDELARQSRRDY